MDSYEVTRLIFTKIKNLDPENASKIMGYILIQDLAAKDLVRLAYGPDTLLHSLILRAKIQLGLCSNTSSTPSTPSSPSPLNPIARPNSSNSSNPFSQSSPRIPNGFDVSRNPSSPSSNSWPLSGFPNNPISPKSSPLLSYDNIRTGSFPLPVFSNHHKNGGDIAASSDIIDEHQLNEYLSFLNESSSSSRAEDLVDPRVELGHGGHDWAHSVNNGDAHFHRRSYSASDACFGSDESGLGTGYKPCLYFARGFCKNGSNCKFVHGGFADSVDASGAIVGSPSKHDGFEQHEEFMRLKAAQQQRLVAASQFMNGGVSPSQYKYMNFLLQQQNDPQRAAAAAAFIMGEEFYKFGRCRPERNDFLSMASAEKANSASRQIYLTFPAESTFKDEDVSEYFNKFGPVQDVRIPYQQKRMFGFVTFVHPETVRFILSKGNPHFICDSRVLVKPYKEKGKVLDKRQQHQQQQQHERGEFSPCLSPSGLDSREPYDLHLGGRMFYNTQEMLLRRKLEEQAELQQAIELQGRRLMNLQLPDLKNDRLHHHQRSLSVGAPVPLPPQAGREREGKGEGMGSKSEDFSVLVLASDLGIDARPFLSNREREVEEAQDNWHDCPQYLSSDEDFSDLELLHFFRLQGSDKSGNRIVRIVGKYFPAPVVSGERLKKYIFHKLCSELPEGPFCIVYMHSTVQKEDNSPGITILRWIYEELPTDFKDRLQVVYFVHPGLRSRLVIATLGRFFLSGGLYWKVRYVSRLQYLWDDVKKGEIEIPEFVKDHDDVLEHRPLTDYGIEPDPLQLTEAPTTAYSFGRYEDKWAARDYMS